MNSVLPLMSDNPLLPAKGFFIGSLISVAGFFLLGLMSDYLLGPHLGTYCAARAADAVLPNVQAFWLTDSLDAAQTIPGSYLLCAAAYAAAWSAAALVFGLASFRQLEIS